VQGVGSLAVVIALGHDGAVAQHDDGAQVAMAVAVLGLQGLLNGGGGRVLRQDGAGQEEGTQ